MNLSPTKVFSYWALCSALASLSGCMLDPAVMAGQLAAGNKTQADFDSEAAESLRPGYVDSFRPHKCELLIFMQPRAYSKYLASRNTLDKVNYESLLQVMQEKGCATADNTSLSAAPVLQPANAPSAPQHAAVKLSSEAPKAVAKTTTLYCRAHLEEPGKPGGVQSPVLVISFSENAKAATHRSLSEFITRAQKVQPGRWSSVAIDVADCNIDGSLCYKFTPENVAQQNCNASKAVTEYSIKLSRQLDSTLTLIN